MRKKITTKKKTVGQKTHSKKTSIKKRIPAVKSRAITKPAAEETVLAKIMNVVDETAAKIKTLLPIGTTTDTEKTIV
jgi:hypothetical protein